MGLTCVCSSSLRGVRWCQLSCGAAALPRRAVTPSQRRSRSQPGLFQKSGEGATRLCCPLLFKNLTLSLGSLVPQPHFKDSVGTTGQDCPNWTVLTKEVYPGRKRRWTDTAGQSWPWAKSAPGSRARFAQLSWGIREDAQPTRAGPQRGHAVFPPATRWEGWQGSGKTHHLVESCCGIL